MVLNKTVSSPFDCIKQCDLRGGPIIISKNENLFSTKIFSTIYTFEYTLIIKGAIALFVSETRHLQTDLILIHYIVLSESKLFTLNKSATVVFHWLPFMACVRVQ